MGEVQVRGLFATPVAALMVPDAEARHRELEEIILRKRAENPSLGASNIGGPGDASACRHHPGSFWSGTCYVNDGGCAEDPALGGEFEMFDPRGPAPMMHAPSLKFGGEDGVSAGSAETIRPRPGLMFLFPSFLLYAARPNRGRALRISIGFNLGLYRPL